MIKELRMSDRILSSKWATHKLDGSGNIVEEGVEKT